MKEIFTLKDLHKLSQEYHKTIKPFSKYSWKNPKFYDWLRNKIREEVILEIISSKDDFDEKT